MKIMKKKRSGLLIVLLTGWGAIQAENAQNLRVVWSIEPQTQAVVVWDSSVSNEPAVLVYDTVPQTDRTSGYAFETPVKETGPYIPGLPADSKEEAPSAPQNPDFFYYHAELKNLAPDTVYYLAVKTGEETGREYRFKTAPDNDKPVKLIFAGDSRTHLDVAKTISTNIRLTAENDDSIIALLHGGDFANSTKLSEWKDWLSTYALTTSEDGKLLPIIPIIGNHDAIGKSPIFGQAYGYPGGKNFYYVTQLTPSCRILCLNTEIDTGRQQKTFVRDSLTLMEVENVKWRIAAFHKPVYPAVKEPTSAKADWVPLFEDYGIDLVLESDGHCIKRTVPILKNKEDPNGIVYLGESGYGAPQREPKMERWYLQGDHAFASKGDHFMMLEIMPEAISYSTIRVTGEVADSFVFKPKRLSPDVSETVK